MSEALSLKPSYYEALKRLTLELAGIRLGSDHRFLIETRLTTLARQEGFKGLEHMIEELFSQGQARLALQVVSSLLERDTHFSPEDVSMAHLENYVIPSLLNIYGEQKIRILSFGCSSGQETWSLAIRMHKIQAKYPQLNYEILGVDYPSAGLERAKQGVYTHFEVQRGLPIRDLVAYFDRRGEDWVIKPDLRRNVSFQEHHLLSNLTTLGTFHMIAFRNRLPAYASTAQLRIVRGMSSIVLPLGYLMLGARESIPKVRYGFDPVEIYSGIYLRRAATPKVDDDIDDEVACEQIQDSQMTLLEAALNQRRG